MMSEMPSIGDNTHGNRKLPRMGIITIPIKRTTLVSHTKNSRDYYKLQGANNFLNLQKLSSIRPKFSPKFDENILLSLSKLKKKISVCHVFLLTLPSSIRPQLAKLSAYLLHSTQNCRHLCAMRTGNSQLQVRRHHIRKSSVGTANKQQENIL